MDFIFKRLCEIPSDINEHLPILESLARECESVIELGIRYPVSSWAFLHGLANNQKPDKLLVVNDINILNIKDFLNECKKNNVVVNYIVCNDLDLVVDRFYNKDSRVCGDDRGYDMVFIDTWHIYGQLKRELEKFSPITNKYIAIHDTTTDSEFGETIRCGWNDEEQSKRSGIPVDEIKKGLWPAVEEFLEKNDDWTLQKRYENNNGLTVLKRI